jgi:hypothetical protein
VIATTIPVSLKILLEHVIDYAGLYPPAALPMARAVQNYQAYLESEWSWMLGKFVVSAARLEEFFEEKARVSSAPWRLSVLASNEDERALEQLQNVESVKAIECQCPTLGLQHAAPQRNVYVESTPDQANFEPIKNAGCYAKIRMGGVLESAFPNANSVLKFLRLCVKLELPFKATAGLHHPLRGSYRLTYEPSATRAPMYGYLNLLLATAFTIRRDTETAHCVLLKSDPRAMRFRDNGVRYGQKHLSLSDLHAARALLHSIGSCSFEEPTKELLEVIA